MTNELKPFKEDVKTVEYSPMSIKEILTEMKNTSELMVSLAYSAVLFNSLELAEEVHELEEWMDQLRYQCMMAAMLAARDKNDAEQLAGIIQIASAAEKISNAADSIVEVILRDIEVHPVIRKSLEEATDALFRVKVEKNSMLENKTLGELKLESTTGIRVIAIKRGRRWVYGPGRDTEILADDLLFAEGPKEGFIAMDKIAKPASVSD